MLMNSYEWAQVEQRAELWLIYGERDCFRPEDLRLILGEVRQLRAMRDRLAALNAHYLARLGDPAEAAATYASAAEARRLLAEPAEAEPPEAEPPAGPFDPFGPWRALLAKFGSQPAEPAAPPAEPESDTP